MAVLYIDQTEIYRDLFCTTLPSPHLFQVPFLFPPPPCTPAFCFQFASFPFSPSFISSPSLPFASYLHLPYLALLYRPFPFPDTSLLFLSILPLLCHPPTPLPSPSLPRPASASLPSLVSPCPLSSTPISRFPIFPFHAVPHLPSHFLSIFFPKMGGGQHGMLPLL